MEQLRITAREAGPPTCLYCRDPVEAPTVCERCDATYHADCRAELGRCATPGCAGAGRRAPPPPELAQDGRATTPRGAEERAVAQQPRPPRAAPATRPRGVGAAAVIPSLLLAALLLAITVHALRRPEVDLDTIHYYTPLGVIFGPVVLGAALHAATDRSAQIRQAGGAMLLTLVGGAIFGLVTDAWWNVPAYVALFGPLGAMVGMGLVSVAQGGAPPRRRR